MAKKRTRKQKIKTRARMEQQVKQQQYVYAGEKEPEKKKAKKEPLRQENNDQKKLIVKDLLKTIWIGLIILGLLSLAVVKLR